MQSLRSVLIAALLGLGAGAGIGCSEQKPEPEIASSAAEPSYAQEYPDEVGAVIEAFGKGQVEVGELSGGFGKYPADYDEKVDNARVVEALEQADRAGRSAAYHEGRAELDAAAAFIDEEREAIKKKVAGSAQYVAKQAGCEAEVGSAAANAFDKVVEERFEERLRSINDAQRIVDRHRESLGKKNAAALERQVNEVARASHLAFIALVEQKVRLRAMIEEADTVRRTVDEFIEAERAYQGESGRTDVEKKASHERIEAMKRAQASLDAAVESAKRTVQDMEPRISRSQQQYTEARDKLFEELRARAKR
jgi:hypothetical protein